jgi:DNA-binding transcriptional ArsR family regulator
MTDGPTIAAVASLLGDPVRASMLASLADGRSLTASELGHAAGIGAPTASSHLAKLLEANLLVVERQGRHRYYRLSGPDVGEVLERLKGLAQRAGATRARTGPKDEALRTARTCYDHLAGAWAVAAAERLEARGLISFLPGAPLPAPGRAFFTAIGLDVSRLEVARRPMCRACLDWSERRSHLGGALGAAILDHLLAAGWANRAEGRAIHFTAAGKSAFDDAYGLPRPPDVEVREDDRVPPGHGASLRGLP